MIEQEREDGFEHFSSRDGVWDLKRESGHSTFQRDIVKTGLVERKIRRVSYDTVECLQS